MSNYESEHGEWKLPSAEYAKFRKKMQETERIHKEKVFAFTQECWKSMTRKQQTDPEEYVKAVRKFVHDKREERGRALHSRRWTDLFHDYSALPSDFAEAIDEAESMMGRKVEHRSRPTDDGRYDPFVTGKPARVLASDMGYPTNRTTSFCIGEASVDFDPANKTVRWDVDENNHAVERAHETPIGKAFFAHLDTVRWTHGTGGYTRYSSEYNEDEFGGRAGSSINAGWGYIGMQEAPFSTPPFINAKGQRVDKQVKTTRGGGWTVKTYADGPGRGKTTPASNRGSFASRYHGEAGHIEL